MTDDLLKWLRNRKIGDGFEQTDGDGVGVLTLRMVPCDRSNKAADRIEAQDAEVLRLRADLAEMTRRRDEWRKVAETKLPEVVAMIAERDALRAEVERLRDLVERAFCEGFGFASIDHGRTNLDAIIASAENQWRGSQSRAAVGEK